MTIKSSPVYWALLAGSFCFLPLMAVAFIVGGEEPIPLLLFMEIYFLWAIVQTGFVYCRTFVLDKDGCTVKFLGYQKTYKWSELQTKRVVDFKRSFGEPPYKACVILSPKKRKNRRLKLTSFALYFHPFSIMFIFFDPHEKREWSCPEMYSVDEEAFMQKMAEWNVEIRDKRHKR